LEDAVVLLGAAVIGAATSIITVYVKTRGRRELVSKKDIEELHTALQEGADKITEVRERFARLEERQNVQSHEINRLRDRLDI